MRKYSIFLALSFFFILNLDSKPIEDKNNLIEIEFFDENYNLEVSDNQCTPSWKWIGDNFCNIDVRVDNPCNQRVYFYIVLNNCTGPNCIRCYYVNPGSFIVQPMNWCAGGTFYWGSC